MKIGSLFSGIGGLDLGLEWAGVGHTVWQVERDPFCRSVLERHWPNAARFDDVCTVGAHNLEPVDVICGGFPCQDISYAGKGLGLAGERSGLWYEFARIVGEMGPRFVVVENVAALITRGIGDVLGTLSDLGYDAQWRAIRASDVGAPHRRERIFIVAYADNERHANGATVGTSSATEGCGGDSQAVEFVGGRGTELRRTDRDRSTMANADEHGSQGERVGRIHNGEREAFGDHVDGCDVPHVGNAKSKRRGRKRAKTIGSRDARGSSGDGPGRGVVPKAQSGLGRAAHGLPERLDRWPASPGETQHEWEAPRTCEKADNRAARLRALGNAVVPQVGAEIGKWLLEIAQSVPQ